MSYIFASPCSNSVPALLIRCRAFPVSTRLILGVVALWTSMVSPTAASIVLQNDFESNATGFSNAGVLPALTRTSLPTDGGGLSSPNQSMWLGRLGEGIAKAPRVSKL